MRRNKGFLLEQVLISIMIISILLPISISCIQLLQNKETITQNIQDEIALRQLRQILLLSYDISYNEDVLTFTYQQKQWELYYRNQHLVLTPGTQIFITEIEQASFFETNECIYLVYQREGETFEKILIKQ